MVILVCFLASLVVVPLLAYAVGCFLPRRFESEVMAYIHRSRDDIWNAVVDHEKNPLTGKSAKQIVPMDGQDDLPCWREQSGAASIAVRTTAMRAPETLARELLDDHSPRRAELEYRLTEANQGCRIAIVNRTDMPRGHWRMPFYRLLMTLDGTGRGVRDYLTRLAEQMDEPVRFE